METVIVFRACAPLAVSVFDYAFHKRALPSARSCAGMLVIVAGALGYVSTDNRFLADGLAAYFWVLVWWGLLVFQLTCGTPREDAERGRREDDWPSTANSSISGARPEGGAGGRCWWALLVVGNLNSEMLEGGARYGKHLVSNLGIKSAWSAVPLRQPASPLRLVSSTCPRRVRPCRCSTPTPSRCCRRC